MGHSLSYLDNLLVKVYSAVLHKNPPKVLGKPKFFPPVIASKLWTAQLLQCTSPTSYFSQQ